MNELKWFAIGFIVLWVLWAAAGGYNDTESKDKPLLRQPAPIQDGKPYRFEDLKR